MADFIPLTTQIGVGPGWEPSTPDEVHAAEQDKPGFLKAFGAAFRTDNIVGSLMSREDIQDPLRKDDSFDWGKAIDGLDKDQYGDLYDRFVDVHNQGAFDGIRQQIDNERENRRILDEAGWRGGVASMVAGAADLPSLIPVGGLFASLGKGAVAGAARTAAGAAIGVAVQEAGLHSLQETRTGTESAVNIGVGTIMGGILGGAAGLLTAGERQSVQKAIARQLAGDEAERARQFSNIYDRKDYSKFRIGEGTVLYHGTKFSTPSFSPVDANFNAKAVWFGFSPDVAKLHASENGGIYQSSLAPGKYWDFRNPADVTALVEQMKMDPEFSNATRRGTDAGLAQGNFAAVENDVTQRALKALGYDGFVFHDFGPDGGDLAVGLFDKKSFSNPSRYAEDAQATSSAGAAATERLSREALTPSGTLGRAATEFAQINPNNRLNMSASPVVREIGQGLADVAAYQEMHDAGKSLGPSVEIRARQLFRERMSAATGDADKIYRSYRKSTPGAMTSKEFDEAVGRAMVNNDVDANGNDFVTQAAQNWRSKVIEPFKNDAISVGMLPEDIKTTTAPSYLHRVWNRQKLLHGETSFKATAAQWMRDAMPSGDIKVKGGARILDEQDLKDYIDEAVNSVFDKLTGRIHDEATSEIPDWIVPVARGPLKDRTFNIPDALVEDYLDRDIRLVANKYSRTMAADVETTRKFGRADMRDQIAATVKDYDGIRASVRSAATIEEARKIAGVGVTKRSKKDILNHLFSAEQQDLTDIKALRDLVRGSYGRGSDATWARISRAATAFNYIRLMGGATIANLSDILRPAMVHGLGVYMKDGIAPLVTNLKGVKMAVAEAKEAGIVAERVLHERLMSMADVGDRFAEDTKFERLLQNGTRLASRWNGILLFTDAAKSIASVMSQNRIIKGVLNGGDDRYLAYLGIDTTASSRMRKMLSTHAKDQDGIWVANSSAWDDDGLRRQFRAALMRDVDSIIVQKSVGDVPLFANTATGKMLLQFRTFSLAAHQRVLVRGLQEGRVNFVSGMAAMTSLGMMVAYLRALRGGSERFEKFTKAAENPGYLIGEGLDLSGIFTLGFEVANTAEKITKRNPIKDPLKWAMGDPNVGESVRFSSRGVAGSLLGPTVGLVDMLSTVAQRSAAKIEGKSTEAQDKALVRQGVQMLPFYSYPGSREIINLMIE